MKMLVIGRGKPYDFKNEQGQRFTGVKVFTLVKAKKDGQDGYLPMQQSIPSDYVNELKTIPGYYDFDFTFIPGMDGKGQMAVEKITYLGDCEELAELV